MGDFDRRQPMLRRILMRQIAEVQQGRINLNGQTARRPNVLTATCARFHCHYPTSRPANPNPWSVSRVAAAGVPSSTTIPPNPNRNETPPNKTQ